MAHGEVRVGGQSPLWYGFKIEGGDSLDDGKNAAGHVHMY
jgi:hypothetical protein